MSAPSVVLSDEQIVMWQVRWTNPTDDPHRASECRWEEVTPRVLQSMEQRLAELRSHSFDGKPCYEVRPLYAASSVGAASVVPQEGVSECADLLRQALARLVWWEAGYGDPTEDDPCEVIAALRARLDGLGAAK